MTFVLYVYGSKILWKQYAGCEHYQILVENLSNSLNKPHFFPNHLKKKKLAKGPHI